MKKSILFMAAMLLTASAFAQLENPVFWTFSARKTGNNEAIIYLKATIEDGWHIYSQYLKSGGPVRTNFTFQSSNDYKMDVKTSEPKPFVKYEGPFRMNVSYFENEVVFQQRMKLNRKTTVVKGQLQYMACKGEVCLPPESLGFSVPVK